MVEYTPKADRGQVLFQIRRVLILAFLAWAIIMPVCYLSGTEFCAPLSALFRFPLFLYLARSIPPLVVLSLICVLVCLALVLTSTRRHCRSLSAFLVVTLAVGVDIWGQIMCYQAYFSPDKELLSYRGYLYFNGVSPMDASMYLISIACDILLFLLCVAPLIGKRKQAPDAAPDALPETPGGETITTDNWLEIFAGDDEEQDGGEGF